MGFDRVYSGQYMASQLWASYNFQASAPPPQTAFKGFICLAADFYFEPDCPEKPLQVIPWQPVSCVHINPLSYLKSKQSNIIGALFFSWRWLPGNALHLFSREGLPECKVLLQVIKESLLVHSSLDRLPNIGIEGF